MAKPIRRKESKRKAFRDEHIPLTKANFVVMGVGLLVIVAGYLAMYKQPVEGFLPLVLAPILLVLGYCVIIPLGILYKKSYIRFEEPSADQNTKPA